MHAHQHSRAGVLAAFYQAQQDRDADCRRRASTDGVAARFASSRLTKLNANTAYASNRPDTVLRLDSGEGACGRQAQTPSNSAEDLEKQLNICHMQ